MYLSHVRAENFRMFGPAGTEQIPGSALDFELTPGLNVLVGANDSGKTAVVDAIRLCLHTVSADYQRVTRDDFHCAGAARADQFTLRCQFRGLSDDEQAAFLELLDHKDREPVLYVTLRARMENPLAGGGRVSVSTRAGRHGTGPVIDGAVRERLRATYLKPLRDAEAELRPGRGSRLAQILAAHPDIREQELDDFDPETGQASTLTGILHRADHQLAANLAVTRAREEINTNYLSRFAIGDAPLSGEIGVAGDASLQRALERLELRFAPDGQAGQWTRRGLGYHNALFMAAELLLLGTSDSSSVLLIEEPEAHLHPQLQARVMELLVEKATGPDPQVQVVLTTHSPNIAAALPVENLTLMCEARAFGLSRNRTKLDDSDYAFLRRFLDVTKANLFFARGVVLVEGPSEALLLPALAEALGYSFTRAGVSIVDVGHIGHFRYARIFQRAAKEEPPIPIKVVCLRDRDLAPEGTDKDMRGKLPLVTDLKPHEVRDHCEALRAHDGGPVTTYVSDAWTLEYDLAATSWTMARLVHTAVLAARASQTGWPDKDTIAKLSQQAADDIDAWRDAGTPLARAALEIYRPLRTKKSKLRKPDAAQHLADLVASEKLLPEDLPRYLIDAITHLCAVR
ncbi:AAA family ATPase [Yinghuangia aomiensis]|uniref:AAA family ATPase n=1 Tax=Yinghuangia aomiensis TaxID=676205 RepID=A0ABP9II43_9ACTN